MFVLCRYRCRCGFFEVDVDVGIVGVDVDVECFMLLYFEKLEQKTHWKEGRRSATAMQEFQNKSNVVKS